MLMLMYAARKYRTTESNPSGAMDGTGLQDAPEVSPVSWVPDGSAFMIIDWSRTCEELLPLFGLGGAPGTPSPTSVDMPKQVKLQSFIRRMYRWGFRQFQFRAAETNSSAKGSEVSTNKNQLSSRSDAGLPPLDHQQCVAFRHSQFRRDQIGLLREMRINQSKASGQTKAAPSNLITEVSHQEQRQHPPIGEPYIHGPAIAGRRAEFSTERRAASALLANSDAPRELLLSSSGREQSTSVIPSVDRWPGLTLPIGSSIRTQSNFNDAIFSVTDQERALPSYPIEGVALGGIRIETPLQQAARQNHIQMQLTHHLREAARLQRQNDIHTQLVHHLREVARLQLQIESEPTLSGESFQLGVAAPSIALPLAQPAQDWSSLANVPTHLAASFQSPNHPELYSLGERTYSLPSLPLGNAGVPYAGNQIYPSAARRYSFSAVPAGSGGFPPVANSPGYLVLAENATQQQLRAPSQAAFTSRVSHPPAEESDGEEERN
jgi:HSF-type DNA-binding